MERLNGLDLQESLIRHSYRWSFKFCLKIFSYCVKMIQYYLSKGIVHNEIKLEHFILIG